jgi:hypothetical protein
MSLYKLFLFYILRTNQEAVLFRMWLPGSLGIFAGNLPSACNSNNYAPKRLVLYFLHAKNRRRVAFVIKSKEENVPKKFSLMNKGRSNQLKP